MGLILIIGMEMGTEERDTAAELGLPLEGTEKGLFLPAEMLEDAGFSHVTRLDDLGLEPGGFVKLAADGCDLRVKKVHLIEMGDLSPEVIEAYVRAATAAMSQEKQIEMAALLLERARKECI